MDIEIYSKENLENIRWPKEQEVHLDKPFLKTLMNEGISHFISNAEGVFYILVIENKIIPIILASGNKKNCYLCSPYEHYVSYAKSLLPRRKKILIPLIDFIGAFVHFCGLNDVIYVNNWLLSENIYSDLTFDEVREITFALKKKFPKKIILWPSLNKSINYDLMENLKRLGYEFVYNRTTYIVDSKGQEISARKSLKSDKKRFKKSGYFFSDFKESDVNRVYKLYSQLYINKHFKNNPHLTKEIFKAYRNSSIKIKTLKKGDKIDAVYGFKQGGSSLVGVFIGYDLELPQKNNLYPTLIQDLLQEGERKEIKVNLGAGNGGFKRNKGAQAYDEFIAFYNQDVKISQKFAWFLLKSAVQCLEPIFKVSTVK